MDEHQELVPVHEQPPRRHTRPHCLEPCVTNQLTVDDQVDLLDEPFVLLKDLVGALFLPQERTAEAEAAAQIALGALHPERAPQFLQQSGEPGHEEYEVGDENEGEEHPAPLFGEGD